MIQVGIPERSVCLTPQINGTSVQRVTQDDTNAQLYPKVYKHWSREILMLVKQISTTYAHSKMNTARVKGTGFAEVLFTEETVLS